MMPIMEERAPGRQPRLSRTWLSTAMHQWQLPPLPLRFSRSSTNSAQARLTLAELGKLTRSGLSTAKSTRTRAAMELSLIDWLYDSIRRSIKRGRLFEIDRVLSEGEADCLGYANLFQQLGRGLALDTGIVEVVIDNAGRLVPHVVNIVRLSDRRIRFIDLWYGSTNVRHRRIGLMVNQAGRWRILDADWGELGHFENIKGLPPRCVDAITGYMIGNRHLERGIRLSDATELHEAIRCYTNAMAQYPHNARLYFNRAVAYESLSNQEAAEADYAIALRDEASLIRVQARQHDEVVRLIALDQLGLRVRDEEMYLLRKGFVTGRKVSPQRIAARYHMSADDVNRITSRIESQLLAMDSPSLGQRTST
jgi:tetratricopeptide (TPR) repeat protein